MDAWNYGYDNDVHDDGGGGYGNAQELCVFRIFLMAYYHVTKKKNCLMIHRLSNDFWNHFFDMVQKVVWIDQIAGYRFDNQIVGSSQNQNEEVLFQIEVGMLRFYHGDGISILAVHHIY